jgi:hypothetical protein
VLEIHALFLLFHFSSDFSVFKTYTIVNIPNLFILEICSDISSYFSFVEIRNLFKFDFYSDNFFVRNPKFVHIPTFVHILNLSIFEICLDFVFCSPDSADRNISGRNRRKF